MQQTKQNGIGTDFSGKMTRSHGLKSRLGKMLILSNGYYGGIYYHGILLDAFRKWIH